MAIQLQTTEYYVIYVLSKADIKGAVKIGKTSVKSTDVKTLLPNSQPLIQATQDRLKSIVTFGVTDIKIEHVEVAWFVSPGGEEMAFWDHDVHDVLKHSNYKKRIINSPLGDADEWYEVDVETAKKAITAVKECKDTIDGPVRTSRKKEVINFRKEQNKAIEQSIDHYHEGDKMLWNAKMRFGKTLCALELIRKMKFKRTLILTHRPTVREGWFEDYHKINFENYEYGSKSGEKYAPLDEEDLKGKDFKTLQERLADSKIDGYIYFASMQDLRGSKKVSDKGIEKNHEVFKNDWDFIILDEAHEGTQTQLGKNVIRELTQNGTPKLLYLSGTPYNILSQFEDSEIYTWDYVMEQTAKAEWPKEHGNEKNPYAGLAQMNIYTYNLGDVFTQSNYMQSDEDFFNFAEFFRVWSGDEAKDGATMPAGVKIGDFIHAEDVRKFLDLLCEESDESNYPFSCEQFRSELSHTLWMVPGVAQAQALEAMIVNHPLQTEMGFYVVNVAGEGSKIESADPDDEKIEKLADDALSKVKLAIRGKAEEDLKPHNRTITLSCGRLTTGVSVPEWTGVLMLSGGYSTGAANYMQTIFRCQTPFKNGAIKSNCYAFDFAPDRTLTVIDDWVAMRPSSQGARGGNSAHTQKVASLLKFCPVIAMKGSSETVYDALSFVKQVNDTYTDFIIKNGFKGRKLVKDFASFSDDDYELLEQIGKLFGGKSVKTNSNGEIVLAGAGLTGQEWTCPNCGEKVPTGDTCPKCGAQRPPKPQPQPKEWECKKCGHKGNKGIVCDNCGEPRPGRQSRGWSCPNCGHSGNHGDYCDNCHEPKPRTPKQESDRRRKAQNVLDQVFVRLPMLLFGAVEDASSLTIDELISDHVIDNESWSEFMPVGFTKGMMKQIDHLIRIDRLIASASRTIEEAKLADDLPIQARIVKIASMLSRFHFPDKETVLTPWRVVNMHMTDTLGGYDFYDEQHEQLLDELRFVERGDITTTVFCDPDTKILELNSKSGVYPLWLACTLWKLLGHEGMTSAEEWELWKKVLEKNLYIVCKTRMAEKITRRVLIGYRKDIQVNTASFEDLIERIKDESKLKKLIQDIKTPATYKNNDNTMIEFKAIVGNPPYQKIDGGGGSSAIPLYNEFVNLSKRIEPSYISLIIPARWYSGGKGLDSFRKSMIEDMGLAVLHDFIDSQYCFPSVAIEGGVCYFLWDRNHDGFCSIFTHQIDGTVELSKRKLKSGDLDIFIRLSKVEEITKRILEHTTFESFSQIVGPRNLFGIPSSIKEEDITESSNFSYKVFGRFKNEREWKKLQKKFTLAKGVQMASKWKIFISKADGAAGQIGNPVPAKIIGLPEIGAPGTICTETFLVVGPFNSDRETINAAKYMQTKFFRFCVGIRKNKNMTQDTYQYVPMQDFNQEWTDEKLYRKYSLTSLQIGYIESMIM